MTFPAYPTPGSSPWSSTLKAYLDASSALLIGPSNGSDDTSTINAALASGAKLVRGTPGENYQISTPLIVPSNITLDMTGATVTLKSGSNCNMVNNTAVSTVQRTIAGTINAASPNFTLTTGTASSADVGRTFVVAGAGPSGTFTFSAKVRSFTDSTHVVLDTAAYTSVTAASTSVYDRDSNIQVVGGIWNRSSNGGSGDAQHSLFFRRLDNLTVDIEQFLSTGSGPKYAVHPGDVSNFDLRVRYFNHVSDGIHVRGPARAGVIHGVAGSTGDDFVVLGASDSTRVSGGAGDIVDVEIYDLRPTSNATNAVKLYGDPGTKISGVHINGERGSVGGKGLALGASDVTGVTLDDIVCENIRSDGTIPLVVQGCTAGTIRLRNLCMTDATATDVLYAVSVSATATVDVLDVDGVEMPNFSSTASSGAVVSVFGTVTDLVLSNYKVSAPASGCGLLLNGSTAVVTRARISNAIQANGGAVAKAATSTQVLGEVWVRDVYATGTAFLVDTAVTTVAQVSNVDLITPSNGSFNIRATGNLTLLGSGGSRIGGAVSTTAGYAFRCNCSDFSVDVSKVTAPSVGDELNNSNGSTAPFVTGPLNYWDGAWRPRAPYAAAGTKVLAAGTGTVTDTKITASSRIRLFRTTTGGTPGHLSYTLSAGASFTINASGGADTSTIYYEIVSY